MAFYSLQDVEKMADLSRTVFLWLTNEGHMHTDTHTHKHKHTHTHLHTHTHTHRRTHAQGHTHSIDSNERKRHVLNLRLILQLGLVKTSDKKRKTCQPSETYFSRHDSYNMNHQEAIQSLYWSFVSSKVNLLQKKHNKLTVVMSDQSLMCLKYELHESL